ncbi:MAG: hypothetical protein R3D62_03185 [Xanthobacteraceae bacterium]
MQMKLAAAGLRVLEVPVDHAAARRVSKVSVLSSPARRPPGKTAARSCVSLSRSGRQRRAEFRSVMMVARCAFF